MLRTKTTAICWGNSLTHISENYLVIWRMEQPPPPPLFFLFFLNNQSSFILMGNTSLAPPGITVHDSKRLQMHIFLWDFPTNLSVQTNHWSIRASQHKASQQMHLSIVFSASPRLANKASWLYATERKCRCWPTVGTSSAATRNLILSHLLLVAASKKEPAQPLTSVH